MFMPKPTFPFAKHTYVRSSFTFPGPLIDFSGIQCRILNDNRRPPGRFAGFLPLFFKFKLNATENPGKNKISFQKLAARF